MKARILFLIVIVMVFSVSVSAQVGARVYSQTEFDSVKAELNKLDDATAVNVALLRKTMTYLHDLVLKNGHKEYVSMPNITKGGTLSKLSNDINNIALFTKNLDESIANVEIALSGDETLIEITEIKTETKMITASELAMQEIKKSVAARRAAQK